MSILIFCRLICRLRQMIEEFIIYTREHQGGKTMKHTSVKSLCLALIFCLLLSFGSVTLASGEMGASGEASGEAALSLSAGEWKFSRTEADGEYLVTVTQFSGDPDENGVVMVPKILGGGIVTAIGMTAFRHTGIRAVLLPDSIKTVEPWAFYDCTNLTYVTGSETMAVDEAAFQNSPAQVITRGSEWNVTIAPAEAADGFDLLVLGNYILPDGMAAPTLSENYAILRADAKATLSASGNTWIAADYDGSAVDLSADEPEELIIAQSLADFDLTVEEIDMTFRALTAEEAEEMNTAVRAGSFAGYASRLNFEEGFYLNGGKVSVDAELVAYDAAGGHVIADYTGNKDLAALYANPVLDALGVKNKNNPYNYVAFRDTDKDGDIDRLFYANTSLPSSGSTVSLTGELAYAGISGAASSEMHEGKVGRPLLDAAFLSFENAAVEAGEGQTVSLASAEISTADGSVLGQINQERSLLWADKGGEINVGVLNGHSTSEGNWTKIRDELNSYAGQPMEVIMQWGMGAAIYASQGGIVSVGDPAGARSYVHAAGDGANGVLATGILDETQPSQIYIYNTDFVLEGWNNHVADTIYGGYVYLEDVTGVTGKAGSYIMNNGSTLANDFGDGTVEVVNFDGEAWGDSSAGIYVIGSGSVAARDSSLTSHLNAAVKALGGGADFVNTDLTGMTCYSGSGSAAEFDGGTWTVIRDYEGDGYVYGKAAAEIAQLWYDITGSTTLLSYVMSGIGNTYADLYTEYAAAIDAWGGKDAFYAAVNDIADRYGYGEAYHAGDDVLLRNSMFDNTYYAIMRNGFQYSPVDGAYRLDALADFSDVPYLGASNLKSIPVAVFEATGTVNVKNVTFAYDDSVGEDYRHFSVGKGTVNLTDSKGAAGIVSAGTVNFIGTDFEGSFAAGNKGLWDGPIGYIDGAGEYTYRNGNYSGAEAAGAVASFTDGSIWTVTHDSYLAGLTIGEDAAVIAPAGKSLTMTVDGTETNIAPGSYSGEIVITLK